MWNNPGTGDSPAAPGYSDDELMGEMFRMLWNTPGTTGNLGVLKGWGNELEVTDGGGLNASVDTGAAVDYGYHYENTTATNVACPNNATVHVVVRCSWAAQTVRLTQVAALVQNPGVTYDIPLAEVTTVAGAITLITDEREFCEYPTEMYEDVVETEHIVADAITTAKLENQTRSVVLGGGQFEPDATNPATFVQHTGFSDVYYRPYWRLQDAVTEIVWCTFRVPADISSATMTVYVWNLTVSSAAAAVGVRWGWSAWSAASSAVLANSSNAVTVDQTGRIRTDGAYRDSLGTITVNAGDIVHLEVFRDGAHAGDTDTDDVALFGMEFEYTADS